MAPDEVLAGAGFSPERGAASPTKAASLLVSLQVVSALAAAASLTDMPVQRLKGTPRRDFSEGSLREGGNIVLNVSFSLRYCIFDFLFHTIDVVKE